MGLFETQPPEYRDAVLPASVIARLAIEAGLPLGWENYVGPFGDVVGIAAAMAPRRPTR